ncbi:hypothetical protein BAE44_0008604, partial [Dichanthelium oligosanthes]
LFDVAGAEEAESFACREGLKLAAEWSPNQAILESDCLTVRKEHSTVAHELAQLARRLCYSSVWRVRSPSCVEHLIAEDCNFSIE